MTGARFGLIVLFALAVSRGFSPLEAAELYAAGGSLYRIDTANPAVSPGAPKLDSQATDLEVGPRGDYVAVSTSWGVRLFTPSFALVDSFPLGIIDAIEIDENTNTIYALVHPGTVRKETRGRHRLVAIRRDASAPVLDVVEVGPLSFDFFLSPDGRLAVITNNVGREVDVVDLMTRRVTQRTFRDPSAFEGMVVLRAAAWRSDSRHLLVAESARGLPLVLWEVDVLGDATKRHPMPWMTSGVTMTLSGSELLINGRDQLLRADATTIEVKGATPCYRDITDLAVRGEEIFLVAPSEDGARLLRVVGDARTEILALPDRATRLALSPVSAGG
jgi:hypothetical protein